MAPHLLRGAGHDLDPTVRLVLCGDGLWNGYDIQPYIKESREEFYGQLHDALHEAEVEVMCRMLV